MYKLQEYYLQIACTTITKTIRTTTMQRPRGPSYTQDEIKLLHNLRAQYGGEWGDIQHAFNASSSFERSIKSLQSRYYLKPSQNKKKVRGLPIYYFAS